MLLTKAGRYICDHYCSVLKIRSSKKYFATPTKTRVIDDGRRRKGGGSVFYLGSQSGAGMALSI